jgi:multiple sugar transport system substrate-binding protein
MGKQLYRGVLLALALVLMVTVIGSSAIAETKITMWTFLDPTKTSGREVTLKSIIDSFETENPDIKVVVEPQAWDTLTAKFMAAHVSGNAPDLIWVNSEDMGGVLGAQALAPFENMFLKDWTAEDLEDVADRFWEYGSKDGLHYQMGFSRNYVGVLYRKDLLAEVGYTVPFKNWDEFRQAAKDLTVDQDAITGIKRYGFGTPLTTVKSNPIVISNMLLKEYGTLFHEGGTANWANETGLKAVELLVAMMKEDGSLPMTCLTTNIDDLCTDFAAGKYAMITGPSVRIQTIKSSCVFDPETIGIMAYPSDEEGVPSPAAITGWCVGVWSGSSNKEAAGDFLEYMFRPESDQMWVSVGGQVPMRKSTIAALGDVMQQPGNLYVAESADCLLNAAWANPTEYSVTAWRDDHAQVMQDVLVDGMDPMIALEKAEQTFNQRNGR